MTFGQDLSLLRIAASLAATASSDFVQSSNQGKYQNLQVFEKKILYVM